MRRFLFFAIGISLCLGAVMGLFLAGLLFFAFAISFPLSFPVTINIISVFFASYMLINSLALIGSSILFFQKSAENKPTYKRLPGHFFESPSSSGSSSPESTPDLLKSDSDEENREFFLHVPVNQYIEEKFKNVNLDGDSSDEDIKNNQKF